MNQISDREGQQGSGSGYTYVVTASPNKRSQFVDHTYIKKTAITFFNFEISVFQTVLGKIIQTQEKETLQNKIKKDIFMMMKTFAGNRVELSYTLLTA